MSSFDVLSFEHSVRKLRAIIEDMHQAEKNVEGKILFLAEKLRAKNIKNSRGKSLSHHEHSSEKKSKSQKLSHVTPLVYLVLLRKSRNLAIRLNYPGRGKEIFIPLLGASPG